MRIWQIDPANLTPYYNIALCQALAHEGHKVRFVTSQFLYDANLIYPDTFITDFHYFGILQNKKLLRVPRLRKSLCALSYPLAHWRLLSQLKRSRPDLVHVQWSRMPV